MKLDIVFHEIDSSDAIRAHIEEKAQKIERFVAPDEHVRVVVEAKFKGQRHTAEVDWHCNRVGKNFFAKAEGHHLYTQIDEAFAKVVKQAQSALDKEKDNRRHSTPTKKLEAAND